MIGWIVSVAFQFHIMIFAINLICVHGPSNEMRWQLQPNKSKSTLC